MKVLLDTHTLIWAAARPALLGARAAEVIVDPATTVLISAASAWEIGIKVRLGKLALAEALERDLPGFLLAAGYTALPIDLELALRAARLPGTHRDPFDRVIAAQALTLDIPLVSSDSELDRFGVRRIW